MTPGLDGKRHDLTRLRRYVAEGSARTAKLEAIIQQAKARGESTFTAEGLLAAFHEAVELMQAQIKVRAHPLGADGGPR